ncbi:PspC domain-containing protein [Nocardioides coralli]|uniref:PspC domain-containing protein n=1 Tax=Nocardioides coralli TaxID=2872154 RepID=UPI001CA41672|nr:PspC domain-containing protein [Nocardioides coralli]QZY29873.1 PspC domain-containing protein [Nocardioides coralli]
MTTTPPDAPTDEGPRVSRDEVRDLGRLRRTTTDRKVAGVAGGLARHLDIDPIILRVAFVVLAFFGGAGLILYAAAWALVPEDGASRAPVHLDERSRTIALIGIAVVAALALVGDSWGAFWFPWPLVILGLIVFVWLSRSGRGGPETVDAAGEPGTAYSSPSTRGYVAPPRDPRKRGPVLFWFTLALIAFSLGLLGLVEAAGVAVTDSAYPALALGIIGAMLVVGSTMGRAGGLIALGLVGSVVLVIATASDSFEGEQVVVAPTSSASVQDRYELDAGEMLVDLSGVEDPEGLAGRTIETTAQVGSIEVIVPEELDVEVFADIGGPGGYDLFDRDGGGIGVSTTGYHEGTGDAGAELTIDADIQVGEIIVRSE